MAQIIGYSDSNMMYHHSLDEHPTPSEFVMHTHDRCEIYLFLSGKGVFWVEGNQYPLTPGDLLILRPFETHCIAVDEHVPYERTALHFHPSLIDAEANQNGTMLSAFFDREAGKDNLYHIFEPDAAFARQCLERMMRKTPNEKSNLLSHLYPLLFELHQITENKQSPKLTTPEPLSYQILQYINQHITEPLSLDEICKAFYISKSQLCRIFKRSVGTTVWHYITIKRLTLARQQLAQGISPSAACSACGFTDYSVFWRAYRTQFGVSPAKDIREP